MKIQLFLIFLIFINNFINCGYILIKNYNSYDGYQKECQQVNSITIQSEGICINEQVFKFNKNENNIDWDIYLNCSDFENGNKPIGTKVLDINDNDQCNQFNNKYKYLNQLLESDLIPPPNDNNTNYVSIVNYNGNDCNNFNIENIQYFYSVITNQCNFDGQFSTFITCTPTQYLQYRWENSVPCSFGVPTDNDTWSLPITSCSSLSQKYNIKQFCNINNNN